MIEEMRESEAEQEKEQPVDVSDVFGYYATFRVELPSDEKSIDADDAREDVTNEIVATLQVLTSKYPSLRLDYNVGYMSRNPIEIPIQIG
jgi:hypothetical protein